MDGHHTKHPVGVVGQRRGLHRAKTGSGRDFPVGHEARIGTDIGDDGLGALRCRPAAGRAVIGNDREIVKEIGVEPMLGNDPQRAGCRVKDLDVAAVGAEQGQSPVEGSAEQQSKPAGIAHALGHRVQPLDQFRLVQLEAGPGGELLGTPGPVLPAERPEQGSGLPLRGLRLLEKAAEFAAQAHPGKLRERLGPLPVPNVTPVAVSATIHGGILRRRFIQAEAAYLYRYGVTLRQSRLQEDP